MSITFLLFLMIVAVLMILLGWALGDSQKRAGSGAGTDSLEETGRGHVTYFPQVQQAMARADLAFLASRGSEKLARRMSRERRKVTLIYLAFLRQDFERLLRLARAVALLSPQAGAGQEFERLRRSAVFSLRYEMVRMKLLLGLTPLPELGSLSQDVSKLAVRLETAMQELGERAALASELASSLDRHSLDTA